MSYKKIQAGVDNIIHILTSEINVEGTILRPLDLNGFDFPTLKMCAAILCIRYEINIDSTNLVITLLPTDSIDDPERVLKLIQQGGNGGELVVKRKGGTIILSRRSFKKLLWLIMSILTLYITTMFLSYNYSDSWRRSQAIGDLNIKTLRGQLSAPIDTPNLGKLLSLADMYLEFDRPDVQPDVFESSEQGIMIEYIHRASTLPTLFLPLPEDETVTDNDIPLPSVWQTFRVIKDGTNAYVNQLLEPYSTEIASMIEVSEQQKQAIEEILELGKRVTENLQKDLESINAAADDPYEATGSFFSNMFGYITQTTKVSQKSNIEGKLQIAHEMFKILPIVAGELMYKVPNVPYQIGEIFNHYRQIITTIMLAYSMSGLINGILMGFFGWIISFIPDDISDEDADKLVNDAADKIKKLDMRQIIAAIYQRDLTKEQLETIITKLCDSIIPVERLAGEAKIEIATILREPSIQESLQSLIEFNKTIFSRSRSAEQNALIANFLQDILTAVSKKSTAMVVYRPPEQRRIGFGGKKKRTKKPKKAKKAKKTKKAKKAKKTKKAKKAKRRKTKRKY